MKGRDAFVPARMTLSLRGEGRVIRVAHMGAAKIVFTFGGVERCIHFQAVDKVRIGQSHLPDGDGIRKASLNITGQVFPRGARTVCRRAVGHLPPGSILTSR